VRIVADTNAVVSGLLWQGPPRRLIDLARERTITLCTSLVLLAELAEVIARGKFARRVLACALAANAELIVTRDQDLLVLGTFQGIRIAASAPSLELIKASPAANNSRRLPIRHSTSVSASGTLLVHYSTSVTGHHASPDECSSTKSEVLKAIASKAMAHPPSSA
jgi:predicted nucleic acid-binding protein